MPVASSAFEATDNPAMDAYATNEEKEGMGDFLALTASTDVPMADVRDALLDRYGELFNGTDPCRRCR